jgi:membrane protein implicated in regulation of membrane protease activity
MPWLFLALALAAFAAAFSTTSVALAALCLLLALVLLVAWVMGLLARRVDSRSRDEAVMIDPQELRRLREQAEARRNAGAGAAPPSANEPPTT